MADEMSRRSITSPATRQALRLAAAQGYGERMVGEAVDMFAEIWKD